MHILLKVVWQLRVVCLFRSYQAGGWSRANMLLLLCQEISYSGDVTFDSVNLQLG